MKIKAVCEKTGLSDRAIRFYVEQGLLSPQFTENYLGRRSYSFSEEDVKQLNNIAVLRKFGFTVSEIGQLNENTANSKSIIAGLKERKHAELEENVQTLEAINKLDTDIDYTVAELADKLSKASADKALPAEDKKANPKAWTRRIIGYGLFGIVFALYLAVIVFKLYRLISLEYPYVPLKSGMICGSIGLIPMIIFVLLVTVKKSKSIKRYVQLIVLCFCVLVIPFSSFYALLFPCWSQTDDIRNYKKFDSGALTSASFVSSVFPDINESWNLQKTDSLLRGLLKEYKEADYFYRDVDFFLTICEDVYLEWHLEKFEFDAEVARVYDWYETTCKEYSKKGYITDKYITVNKGDYICLLLSKENEFGRTYGDSYWGYLFAYNPKTLTVRYAYSCGTYWGIEPYISELEW